MISNKVTSEVGLSTSAKKTTTVVMPTGTATEESVSPYKLHENHGKDSHKIYDHYELTNSSLVQERGMTPVSILPESEDGGGIWTAETQTANGKVRTNSSSIVVSKHTTSVLHIPGESGELAGSEDYSSDSLSHTNGGVDQLDHGTKIQILAQKLKYKLIFTVSIVTLLFVAFATVLYPWLIPYYHTVVFPILFIIRLVAYSKVHWQLFCLDFCYFVNLALLVFCWAYPQSELFFAIVFGAIMGPVAVAVLVFRNSAVYHDYDRMTSGYIHAIPVLITYIIKWYPEKTSTNWYFSPNITFLEEPMYLNENLQVTSYVPDGVDASWLFVVAIPLVWFVVHTLLYMFVENCVFDGDRYLTSYKWLTGNTKSSIYHILTLGGRVTNQYKVKLLWLTFNILYCILSVLAARLAWEYFIAHTIYVILVYLAFIYNGASFYIDVFAHRGLKD